ncbi:MAG: LysM peptidoglycan-binding domain-containing protein [Anaerolineae bacterium]
MQRVRIYWMIGGMLGIFLLTGCAQPAYNPTPTLEEELPPPVTVPIPFNGSPVAQLTEERSPSLYLNPGVVSLDVGGTATIEVWADGVKGVSALSLEMSFDPLLVQAVDADPVVEGIQAAPGDLMEIVLENKVEGNRLIYQAAVPSGVTQDTGVLVAFSLRGIAPGTALLQVGHVAAQDGFGNPLSVTFLSDGVVTVSGTAPLSPEEPPPPVAETPVPTPLPTAVVAPVPAGAGGIYYVVGPGENLFRIGIKFGTTAQAIADANNIPDPRQVQAGTMVLVPVPAPGGGYGYYVRPGDTVYSIARRFGMTVEELSTLNHIGPDFTIHPGTVLKVVPRR